VDAEVRPVGPDERLAQVLDRRFVRVLGPLFPEHDPVWPATLRAVDGADAAAFPPDADLRLLGHLGLGDQVAGRCAPARKLDARCLADEAAPSVTADQVLGAERPTPVQHHLGTASAFNTHDWLVRRFPSLARYVPEQGEIAAEIAAIAKATGTFLVASATEFTARTASFLLNLFIMLYAMFYFLRDGRQMLEKIFYYTPLNHEDEVRVVERLISVTRATIKGTLLIGIIQGTLAGIGFWVAGIDGAAFWGTVMAVLSVVPGIGAALVWVPAVIYLFIIGHSLAATLLLAWCAAGVGTIDNMLRPKLVGKDAKMPDLLILLGTLGGLFFFGPIGFIIGPLVCGLFLTVWDIYGATFKDVLPPVYDLQSGKVPGEKDTTAV